MPFISEEIWSLISERTSEERLIVASWPIETHIDSKILADEKFAAEVISGIRTIRKEKIFQIKIRLNFL